MKYTFRFLNSDFRIYFRSVFCEDYSLKASKVIYNHSTKARVKQTTHVYIK